MSKPVALVIGGGSGIGADAARKLVEDGFDIAVMSSSGKGEALGQSLGGLGFTGSNLVDADIGHCVAQTHAHYGRLDAAVNCTGHGPKGALLSLSDDAWRTGMDYYLLNVIRAARHLAPLMQAQGAGSIVNVSTFAAFEPDPDFPTSAVFRAALASYTKQFADCYARDGVRMNNVLPGFIDSLPEKPDRVARIPAGRYARVRELSETIAFLASEKSSYVTGQNLRVDGGLTRSV
ncbi:MAG: SDR family oxidoreductase [Pseudomonadota bacterium]